MLTFAPPPSLPSTRPGEYGNCSLGARRWLRFGPESEFLVPHPEVHGIQPQNSARRGTIEQKDTNERCASRQCHLKSHMSEASIESDGRDAFVVYNGVRIAKRGQPNTPEAGTWVSLEPGFRVFDKGYPAELVIERDGKIIKTVW